MLFAAIRNWSISKAKIFTYLFLVSMSLGSCNKSDFNELSPVSESVLKAKNITANQPNIILILGDDIGLLMVSALHLN